MRHFKELTGRYVLALALLFLRDMIMGGFVCFEVSLGHRLRSFSILILCL